MPRLKLPLGERNARRKAYMAEYRIRPEALVRDFARKATPEYKAWERTRNQKRVPKRREQRASYAAKPETKARSIANKYNIPIEIPNRLAPDRCECCGEIPRTNKRLNFDHCHDSGRFRGWCCHHCNTGAGLADNPKRLRLRAIYLERPFQPGPINWAYPKGWKADLSHAV